ncbi:hypothetical protein A3I48_03705 [Candidatus Daviesbacteria bacterium RIFCSPLOWO2_02_FULL_36_7]|uniref:Nudix hydrolase domain-containing protein n=1 Tax=Candidatus Daviesbacteria bacterium RIFCSPLOWO2_02_FULL_36_7 TaxID=1797792 RepID=A0A1F5MG20_9BACT|nr:MAG: hypothetical protein A3I48_03705 [Candidatus Daviesbacteria bacterium RIFCSPLOWO2_02_FULL_36_7]
MCYTAAVHKSFYASGFLYSTKLHKILLLKSQKKDSSDFIWSTIGGAGDGGEEPQAAFARIINEQLGLNLKAKNIYPIYDYLIDAKDKMNYVFYTEVKSSKEFSSLEGIFEWVSFHEISKLSFVPHCKQDVIVGERVVNAKWRDDEAKKLPPFSETSL